jgi:hypothetical protein
MTEGNAMNDTNCDAFAPPSGSGISRMGRRAPEALGHELFIRSPALGHQADLRQVDATPGEQPRRERIMKTVRCDASYRPSRSPGGPFRISRRLGAWGKRVTLLILVAATAVALASPVPLGNETLAKNKGNGGTKTRNFSNRAAITLTAGERSASPYPSVIRVSGFKNARIVDVNVTLRGLHHVYANYENIDVMLVAPNGRTALVLSDAKFDTNSAGNVTITLDDEARKALPNSGSLQNGTFRPTDFDDGPNDADTFAGAPAPRSSALSTFDRSNPNGQWQLFVVYDGSDPYPGGLAGGWDLKITTKSQGKKA